VPTIAKPARDSPRTSTRQWPVGSQALERLVDKYFTATKRTEGRRIVLSLREYIANDGRARRMSREARDPVREGVGEVRVLSSIGMDAASVALPAGIDLDDRAARMNEFWRALVDFQYRDVLVVALCAGDER
jgi:hypothetical protein